MIEPLFIVIFIYISLTLKGNFKGKNLEMQIIVMNFNSTLCLHDNKPKGLVSCDKIDLSCSSVSQFCGVVTKLQGFWVKNPEDFLEKSLFVEEIFMKNRQFM